MVEVPHLQTGAVLEPPPLLTSQHHPTPTPRLGEEAGNMVREVVFLFFPDIISSRHSHNIIAMVAFKKIHTQSKMCACVYKLVPQK